VGYLRLQLRFCLCEFGLEGVHFFLTRLEPFHPGAFFGLLFFPFPIVLAFGDFGCAGNLLAFYFAFPFLTIVFGQEIVYGGFDGRLHLLQCLFRKVRRPTVHVLEEHVGGLVEGGSDDLLLLVRRFFSGLGMPQRRQHFFGAPSLALHEFRVGRTPTYDLVLSAHAFQRQAFPRLAGDYHIE